ncbi:hypothetical protein [Nocardia salmonicida]|uniref:hypothetical protein n=1 Tax=Nocardia salmonicida TaxID=53431 RepID=UPI0007A4D675|nr:hypothetical protein [Nocardia salmonicida]MBC7299806.1 hypothetical protein [Nocardia sp.]
MIENDDLLYRVDRNWLGPTGHALPFRIRYTAIGVGLSVFVTTLFIEMSVLHLTFGFQPVAIAMAVTVLVTSRATKYVNADRPLRSIIRAAWNDLTAPRPPKQSQTVSVSLPSPAQQPRRSRRTERASR